MSCLTVGATLLGRRPEVDGGVFNLSIIFLIWLIFVGPETCDEEPAGYFGRFVGSDGGSSGATSSSASACVWNHDHSASRGLCYPRTIHHLVCVPQFYHERESLLFPHALFDNQGYVHRYVPGFFHYRLRYSLKDPVHMLPYARYVPYTLLSSCHFSIPGVYDDNGTVYDSFEIVFHDVPYVHYDGDSRLRSLSVPQYWHYHDAYGDDAICAQHFGDHLLLWRFPLHLPRWHLYPFPCGNDDGVDGVCLCSLPHFGLSVCRTIL
ncbi:hypothetical protein pdam_00008658 [Pocillopora damicornis]|uniref:Uncharacterized protein n=1 Tax=Pocillopora damicornis TaxID=46731 RepID=A0A3M6TJI5_POCDA|nr:hypothetical protein pdam_00008658 [Pocillopora damicornis]